MTSAPRSLPREMALAPRDAKPIPPGPPISPGQLPAARSPLPAPCSPGPLPTPFTPAANESHKAFETFLAYFDFGHNRSFVKLAKLTGVSLGTIKMWAHRFDWRERVRAYNTELLRARLAVETDSRRNQAELRAQRALHFENAEWKAAEKLLRAAQNALDILVHKAPEKLTLSDVARALEIASKLGRLATGLTTDHIAHTGALDLNLQLEIDSAIKKVYGPVLDVESSPSDPPPNDPTQVGRAVPCAPLPSPPPEPSPH